MSKQIMIFFLFRDYIITGTSEIMKFENVLFGNEMGTWTGTSFIAPVDGIYSFNLHLHHTYSSRSYRLSALVNNGEDGVDYLLENTNYYRSASSYGHSHFYKIERELKVGDTLTIEDTSTNDYLQDYNYYKCYTNYQEHSCSYITGRLIKKL